MNNKKNFLEGKIDEIKDRLEKLSEIKTMLLIFFSLYVLFGIYFLMTLISYHMNGFLKIVDFISFPIIMIPGIISIKHINSLITENRKELKIRNTERDAEIQVQDFLKNNLTEDYHVFTNIPTIYGDIDAVVVGPKGVYAVEVKSNSGTITQNRNGYLTIIDGILPRKNYGKQVVRNMYAIKRMLDDSTNTKSFVLPVLVFPFADIMKELVLAPEDDRYKVPVLGVRELVEYIYSNKRYNLLSASQIKKYCRVFEEIQEEQK